jgi:hypothetical protein
MSIGTLLLHVALAMPPAPVPPAIVHAAVAEAADVWAPYGVAVDAAGASDLAWGGPADAAQGTPCGGTTDDRVVLTIVAIEGSSSAGSPGWRGPLGALTFLRGEPATTITIFLADIERFVAGVRVLGRPHWQWPTAMRQRILGRVLGRVLAHEIGHYVLRSARHTPDGLMRPLQLADDLVAPSRHRFTLTAADAAQLEDRR